MKRVEFILLLAFVGMVGAGTKEWKPEEPISRTAALPDISFTSIDGILGNVSVIRKIDDSLFIGCKDRVVIVDAAAIVTGSTKQKIKPTQIIEWIGPELEIVSNQRYMPTKCGEDLYKNDCGNFIRLIERINGTNVMMCGTGGAKNTGLCRIFEWDGNRIGSSYEMQAEGHSSSWLLSYDFNSEQIWTYSDGKLFLGLVSPNPKLINVLITSSEDNGKWIIKFKDFTVKNQLGLSARFASVVETNETAYLFMYENSLDTCDQRARGEESKKTGARVARVCKNDPGMTSGAFTTFFKARLNCFDKRVIPYSYYEEVQQVKGFHHVNGVPMVFGVFTNPYKNESAVCVYTEEQLNPGTKAEFDEEQGGCWTKVKNVPSPKPNPSWMSCDGNVPTSAFSIKNLLLHKPVNKEGNFPIFTKKETLFSAIAIETNVAMKTTQNISIVYIGTTDGELITVSVDQANVARKGDVPPSVIVSDTQDVFNEEQCMKKQYEAKVIPNQKKVLDIEVFDEHVVVMFLHCAIRVPKAQCDRYACQSFCINSGNPSCGLLNGECVKKTEDNENDMEQGFEVASVGVYTCSEEKMRNLEIIEAKGHDATTITLAIFLSLTSILCLALLLYIFCRVQIRNKYRSVRGKTSAGQNRQDNEYRDIPSDAAALSERQAKKHTRVNFYPRKNNEIQYPGITVEASTLPLRYKPSIIKRESVKFEDDFPEPQPKYNAIPIFQNMKRGSKLENATEDDGEEELEMKPTTSNTGKHNTNNNRVSLHTDGLDFSDSLIYSNARFSLKGLSTTQQQFYGAVDCGQPKSNPLTLNSPVYSSLSPLFSRDPVGNDSKFGGPSREASPMKVLVHPDPTFPPLPACAVLPASAGVVKMASFSGKSTHGLQKPTTPLSSEQSGENKKLTSGEQQSLSTSGSADSTSSGFISASSGEQQQNQQQQHQQDKAAAEISAQGKRKAFIVAKGLLSAQTLASPISPKFMRKHKRVSRQSSGEELRYSIARSSVFLEGERTTSSEYLGSLNDLPLFKNPEYRDSSEDDDQDGCEQDQQHQRQNMMQRIEDGLAKKHRRRPLKLFRSKIPGRRPRKGSEPLSMLDGGCSGRSIDDDEIFASPSYADDEDTVMPQVIGWEEIDYTPLGLSLESRRVPTHLDGLPKPPRAFADNRGHSYDDIDVKTSFTDASSPMVNGAKDITFLTLRPRNRMRQRLPKMRNTEKEWALSGSPKPVPTPSLPRDVIQ